jgi:hypothetical protein
MDPELVDSNLRMFRRAGALARCSRRAWTNSGGHRRDAVYAKADIMYWAASPNARDRTERLMKEGLFWRGQLAARTLAARHAGFLTDLDLFTPDELDREPLIRNFFRPQSIGWYVGKTIPIPTGENVAYVLTRRTERGPFERAIVQKLDDLRPHLARSALLSARLQLQWARVASETLAALDLPALVLNEQGKVLATNSLIEALSVYVQWRAFDRISPRTKLPTNFCATRSRPSQRMCR